MLESQKTRNDQQWNGRRKRKMDTRSKERREGFGHYTCNEGARITILCFEIEPIIFSPKVGIL